MDYSTPLSTAHKIHRWIFVLAAVFTISACGPESVGSNGSTDIPNGLSFQGNKISLSWQPNLDQVDGYIVYGGPTAQEATNRLSTTALTSVKYDINNDLGLSSGDQACFRLRSYRAEYLSAYSEAVCVDIPLT
jgi:hypothetical protein